MIGASGLLGREAAAALKVEGHEVVRTSRSGEGADLACDILEPDSIDEALRSSPDLILLTAGQSSVRAAWRDPSATMAVNTSGVFNVLESICRLAPGARLVFASSATVYGSPASAGDLPFEESSPLGPVSPYGASKAAAEALCLQYSRQRGLAVTIARIFNLIGPGQSEEQVPSEFAKAIATAEAAGDDSATLSLGNPEAQRDFLDVADAASALAGLTKVESGIFNICSGQPVSLCDLAGKLASHSRLEVSIEPVPGRSHQVDVPVVFGSNRKLNAATGWTPEVSLDESLARLLDDWRERLVG